MKKIVWLAVLAILAVYGVGFVKLGSTGAIDFVSDMELLMNDGKADEVCDMYHEDLVVEITDKTSEEAQGFRGGKQEFCAYTRETAAALALLPHRMHVSYEEVEVKRSWLHPWTSEVSYVENRSFSVPAMGQNMSTTSAENITLVHTFSGVKLLKVSSRAYLADGT